MASSYLRHCDKVPIKLRAKDSGPHSRDSNTRISERISSGLEDKDRDVGIFTEPGSYRETGCSSADDNKVKFLIGERHFVQGLDDENFTITAVEMEVNT